MSATATERACPDCGARVPSLAGYVDWCRHCGWNLRPPRPAASGGRFAAQVAALMQRPPRSGGTHATRALAVLIAVVVLLFGAALIVGGVASMVVEPNLVTLLLGATTVLLGVLMRPRIPGRPPGAVLDPAHTPTLHALVARIAEARGVPAPRGIIVDAEWNAAWVTAGVRRERWLVLGLPLLTGLEPQQRVALIAHELGHEHSGDLTRTLVVGSAVDALDTLSGVMDPTRDESPLDWIARPLMWFVSRPLRAPSPAASTRWRPSCSSPLPAPTPSSKRDARAAEIAGRRPAAARGRPSGACEIRARAHRSEARRSTWSSTVSGIRGEARADLEPILAAALDGLPPAAGAARGRARGPRSRPAR